MDVSHFGLRELISPISEKQFFSEYWEKRPLLIRRERPNFYDHLFSLGAVDQILTSTDLRLPAFRLVKNGSEVPSQDYTRDLPWGDSAFEGVADVGKVLDHYRNGATIVLQALQRNWQPIAKFCRHLKKQFSHSVQTNAYLTPKGSQGFNPHYDTHDVLILQVSGVKKWRLYNSPVFLPHDTQKFDSSVCDVGEPESEFDLMPGDFIYIPRGFIHEGLTTDSHSLHLTIAIPTLTWVNVFSEAVKTCIMNPEFRRSLPFGFAEKATIPSEMVRELEGMLKGFLMSINLEEALESVIEKHLGNSDLDFNGSLVWEESLDKIDEGTLFTQRLDVVRRIIIQNEKLILLFGGKKIELPSFCASTIQKIEGSKFSFCARDLPHDIDLEGRLLLVRRLFEEGFIDRETSPFRKN